MDPVLRWGRFVAATRLVVVLPALLAVLAGLAVPAAAGAETYGLGDAAGTFAHCVAGGTSCCVDTAGTCPAGSVGGYYNNGLFRALTGPRSTHRISQLRLFVSYDALQQWNGSMTSPGCVFSRALDQPWYDGAGRFHPAGQSWDDLRAGLIEAHGDGLTPVVSIAGYASPAARPAWDQPAPDPTTIAGYWELRCGVQGVLDAVSRLPAADQPHVWEAFNEPDALSVYNGPGQIGAGACRTSATGVPGVDGAAKAACEYLMVSAEIHAFAGHATDTVIAGALSQPSVPYLGAYAAQLNSSLTDSPYPATWSVHDYGDVTGSYATVGMSALRAFDAALRPDTGGRAGQLWVTETGTELTDPEPDPACPLASPEPTGVSAGGTGTLGACVNGNAAGQALAADAFFALPDAGIAVPITHLFWYQWQGESNWDSAIVDAAGVPRAPWCAFYGSGVCNGDPSAP